MFNEMGAMMKLLANKDKLAGEATKLQQTIAQITAEGAAGGGMVHVKVTGRMEIVSCRLSDEALKLHDREMLEDLIVAATNQALGRPANNSPPKRKRWPPQWGSHLVCSVAWAAAFQGYNPEFHHGIHGKHGNENVVKQIQVKRSW